MKVHHRLCFISALAQPLIERLNIKLDWDSTEFGYLVMEDISEDDPAWPVLKKLLDVYHLQYASSVTAQLVAAATGRPVTQDSNALRTWATFSRAEESAARYLVVNSGEPIGYPDPQDIFAFRSRFFDQSSCNVCWHRATQVAPLSLQVGQLSMRNRMFQVNWLGEQWFVSPDIGIVLSQFQVKCLPLQDSIGVVRDDLLQVDVSTVAHVDVSGRSFRICPGCGEKQFVLLDGEFAPQPLEPSSHMFMSWEAFYLYNPLLYLSQELYQALRSKVGRNIGFWPTLPRTANPKARPL